MDNKWIRTSERLPEKEGNYFVKVDDVKSVWSYENIIYRNNLLGDQSAISYIEWLEETEEPNSISNEKHTFKEENMNNESWNEIFIKYSDEHPLDLEQVRYWFIPLQNWLNKNYPRVSDGLSFNILDNCDAFRDWLDKNEISYKANGHYTSFGINQDIFSIGEKWGIYKYLNKPKEVSNESIELVEKFTKELHSLVFDDNSDFQQTLVNCENIALQYHQSKLEELERWIDTDCNWLQDSTIKSLKAKIKSL